MREHLKEYIDSSQTPDVRGLRILLEYFYANEIFGQITKNRIKVVSVFGSARARPNSLDYRLAYRLGELLYRSRFAVVTGASRGIMQAANQGVADAIGRELAARMRGKTLKEIRQSPAYQRLLNRHSVGLSISLPAEPRSNPFVGVRATFHYFMVRKFFFGTLSSAFVACEGGWGTRDELYEILTLVQTGKAPVMPIIYLSPNFRHLERDFQHALRKKYIASEDLHLIHLVRTPEAAARLIEEFYRVVDQVRYERDHIVRIALKKRIGAATRRRFEQALEGSCDNRFSVEWKGRELLLQRYTPNSYGPLKKAIDLINRS